MSDNNSEPWIVFTKEFGAISDIGDLRTGLCTEATLVGVNPKDVVLMLDAHLLLEALEKAYKALEAIGDEMTVGERFTNAGQYLLDALPQARCLIAKHKEK